MTVYEKSIPLSRCFWDVAGANRHRKGPHRDFEHIMSTFPQYERVSILLRVNVLQRMCMPRQVVIPKRVMTHSC
jgi:hypothetical protein